MFEIKDYVELATFSLLFKTSKLWWLFTHLGSTLNSLSSKSSIVTSDFPLDAVGDIWKVPSTSWKSMALRLSLSTPILLEPMHKLENAGALMAPKKSEAFED